MSVFNNLEESNVEPKIPWYQAAIVRQQIVMIIVGALGLFGVVTDIDWDATVAAIMAAIAMAVPVWTLITRIFKPAPPITDSAQAKGAEIAARSQPSPAPVSPAGKQRGYVRAGMLGLILALSVISTAVLPGCVTTELREVDTFSERLAAAYTAVTFARDSALSLLQAREISPEAAQRAQGKADQVRGALDLADRSYAASRSAGEDRLTRALAVLGEVQRCIDARSPDFADCIERVDTTRLTQ